ncbi:hypothetical protein GCM10009596_23550 [Arthrobacter rhombi]|uniref:hypothetical protein n=1 Tax=Arthrobacter rhombi TaxID=71253 RepID=UPI0031D6B114
MQQPTNNLAAGTRVTHKGTGELGTARYRAFSLRQEADELIARARTLEDGSAAAAIQASGVTAAAFMDMTITQVAQWAEDRDVEAGGVIRAIYEMQGSK